MALSLHERYQILDHIQSLRQYDRRYAARALRTASAISRGRKLHYGSDAKAALIRCWAILNFPTRKRFQFFAEPTNQGWNRKVAAQEHQWFADHGAQWIEEPFLRWT